MSEKDNLTVKVKDTIVHIVDNTTVGDTIFDPVFLVNGISSKRFDRCLTCGASKKPEEGEYK